MSGVPYPDYDDVMRESREVAGSRPGLVGYGEIGRSEEGRAIPLLTLTDPAVPVEQPPNATSLFAEKTASRREHAAPAPISSAVVVTRIVAALTEVAVHTRASTTP